MSVDNFLVRQKRRTVERFQKREAWDTLTVDDRSVLITEVAGLPTAYQDDDLPAKQFDLLTLTGMLRLLQEDTTFAECAVRIKKVASDLESLAMVPLVKHQLPLIIEVQTDDFWQDVTPQELERVRRGLRALVQLIEPGERKIVFTDFTDTIGTGVEIDLEAVSPGVDRARFAMKVRRFLEKHKDHIALQKLRRAEQLTRTDLAELEKMFDAEGLRVAEGEQEIASAGGLGLFLRSLTGLDRKAAKAAFGAFLEGRQLTAAQNEFVDLTINYLTERGAIAPARFYESPFTDLNDLGINGVFPGEDAGKFIEVVEGIRLAAVA